MIIYLASTNEIKYKAVCDCFKNHIVYKINTLSNVSNQPIDKETQIGALNRINNLYKLLVNKEYDYLISIENGVMTDRIKEDLVYDTCIIYLFDKNKKQTYCRKSFVYVYFPLRFYHNIISNGKIKTIGEIISEETGWNKDEWHEKMSGISRYRQITVALKKLAKDIL
jgi:non-canonical (house-cleaning) NTP pyrophosphatase